MDSTERLITLCIHTYHKALDLKYMLEAEGINVTLQNVNLENPCTSPGVRVRIKESDLPLALRIVENPEVFEPENKSVSEVGRRHLILVPIDFSAHSQRATDAAFSIAFAQNADILLLHTYTAPHLTESLQLSDTLSYDESDNPEKFFGHRDSELLANKRIFSFGRILRERIKNGDLPPVKFVTEVSEGIPEEVILRYSKDRRPSFIVMGTRGAGAKERDLVGSVTAEVLDSSRIPVFTVPSPKLQESLNLKPSRIELFVNFDQEDFLALDALHRFLPHSRDMKIDFVHIVGTKSQMFNARNYHALLNYAEKHYPECHFSVTTSTADELLGRYNAASKSEHPHLIVVPSRKRNIFARLFNPGMAHKILFHADIPMMVIPV